MSFAVIATIFFIFVGVVVATIMIVAALNGERGTTGNNKRTVRSVQSSSGRSVSIASESDTPPGDIAPEDIKPLENAFIQENSPIRFIPHSRNAHFFGCNDLLNELRIAFSTAESTVIMQTICGLEGVGKTQLAVEYAYRYAEEYSTIWWVRAERPALLSLDFAELAVKFSLKLSKDAKPDEVREALQTELERRGRWLIVCDDTTSLNAVRSYIPQDSNGHVIIISRTNDNEGLLVNPFERETSARYIMSRTMQVNSAAAFELAELLNDMPLVMEIACAYIEKTNTPLADYLALFKLNAKNAENESKSDPLSIVFEVAYRQLEKESQAGASLITVLSFLSHNAIQKDFLHQAIPQLDESFAAALVNPTALENAVSALRSYSLIEVSTESIFVHPLLQSLLRNRLSQIAKGDWARAAIHLVDSVFSLDINDPRTWYGCSRLLPHALVASNYAEEYKADAKETARLLNEIGLYLRLRSEYIESVDAIDRALTIAEVTYGSSHPWVAVCADNLGSALKGLGDFAGARVHYERALAIDEATYGSNHPNLAQRVSNLGGVLQQLGDYRDTLIYLERALKIAEAAYGSEHPNVAGRVANLGQVYEEMDDLNGALKCFERALKIDEAAYGVNHINIAERVDDVGRILAKRGELSKARVFFNRALRIDQATYGPDHPNLAMRVCGQAKLFEEAGDLRSAREYYESGLEIDEVVYGKNHLNIAIRTNDLGRILYKMNDRDSAKAYYKRVLAIYTECSGIDHPDTIAAREIIDSLNQESKGKAA